MTARDLLGLPWSIAPLEGKYYATRIIDRDGWEVLRTAAFEFPVSERFESQRALDRARAIVALVNAGADRSD